MAFPNDTYWDIEGGSEVKIKKELPNEEEKFYPESSTLRRK